MEFYHLFLTKAGNIATTNVPGVDFEEARWTETLVDPRLHRGYWIKISQTADSLTLDSKPNLVGGKKRYIGEKRIIKKPKEIEYPNFLWVGN